MGGLLEILRDQVWQFVGALLSLIAIVISVWVAIRQRREKAINIKFNFEAPIVSFSDEMEKLEVLFEGTTVFDPHLLEVTLQNSGNVPILAADFVKPVRLSFGDESQILQARVIGQRPDNLGASVKIDSGTVMLEPLLLNPEESCTVRILGTQINDFRADARVVGAKMRVLRPGEDADQTPVIRDYGPVAFIIIVLGLLAFILRSDFIWGFLVAGIVGFAAQRLIFLRAVRRS